MKNFTLGISAIVLFFLSINCSKNNENDTEGLNQITSSIALDMRPVWTPDGNFLYYISNENSSKTSGWSGFSIWKVPSIGGISEKIKTNNQSIHQVNISPDGNSLVYYDGQNEPKWDIYYMSFKDNKVINLTNDQKGNMAPKFSSNGSKIIFSKDINGNRDIWAINIEGTLIEQITTNEASDNFPCFSPDGEKIAFSSNRSGNFDIWVKDLQSGSLIQLTESSGNEFAPCWSNDGKHIAFMNDISGPFNIYTISEDGGVPHCITNNNSDDMYPCWSPDGTKIAFSSNRTGNDDVFVKDFNSY